MKRHAQNKTPSNFEQLAITVKDQPTVSFPGQLLINLEFPYLTTLGLSP